MTVTGSAVTSNYSVTRRPLAGTSFNADAVKGEMLRRFPFEYESSVVECPPNDDEVTISCRPTTSRSS